MHVFRGALAVGEGGSEVFRWRDGVQVDAEGLPNRYFAVIVRETGSRSEDVAVTVMVPDPVAFR